MKTNEMATKLNELLEKNYDTEKSFKQAAENVKEDRLKQFFTEKAKQRYHFGHELKMEINNMGEEPDKGTSVSADARRTWMDIKTALSADNEESFLEEAVRGERLAVEDYNEAISDKSLPPSTANLLIKQRNAIERTFNEVKALEEKHD